MDTEIPEPSPSTVGVTVECFEGCGTDIPVAIWDDNTLAGKLLPVCRECHEQVPEHNLWDASTIEDDEPPAAPDERETHPIPDGDAYAVVEQHDAITGPYVEIFLRDPQDSTALAKARAEARETLSR